MELDLGKAGQVFDNLRKAFEANLPNMLFNAANVGSAEMQWRVFNQGKAADNSVQHYRSSYYKRLRTEVGRQVAYKDWILSGDLFNSLGLRLRGKDVIEYAFNSRRQAEIAGYQEQARQVGKPIFTLNADEIAVVEKAFQADLSRLVKAVNNAPLENQSVVRLAPKKNAVQKSIGRHKEKKAKAKAVAKKKKTVSQKQKLQKQVEVQSRRHERSFALDDKISKSQEKLARYRKSGKTELANKESARLSKLKENKAKLTGTIKKQSKSLQKKHRINKLLKK